MLQFILPESVVNVDSTNDVFIQKPIDKIDNEHALLISAFAENPPVLTVLDVSLRL